MLNIQIFKTNRYREFIGMVEGPTAKAYAYKIRNNFVGETVKDIYFRSKKIYISKDKIINRKIKDSDSIGKNILIYINGYMIRIHLMLYGSIHIYNLYENLLKPFDRVRLMITGYKRKLVVYNAPIVELDEADRLLKRLNSFLGPDPLRNDWDEDKAIKRIRTYEDKKIGVVLLDQNVISGIGNILRNEILFRARVHPERFIYNLSDEEIRNIVRIAKELSEEFLKIKLRKGRIKPLLYVYNRFNKKCRICGKPIKFYIQNEIKRKTFVCENCQK